MLAVIRLVALAALVATGCIKSAASKCGDLVCPDGTSCVQENRCVDSDLVGPCEGQRDGAACTVPGLPPSTCAGGVCQASRCGDGRITGAEECDGDKMGSANCMTVGFYNPDGLRCGADCKFDVSACVGRCGDGVKNGPELCDGPDMGGATCFDVGYYAAAGLKCKSDCTFDVSTCTGGKCGDGVINGLEQCDGKAMGTMTCSKLGYLGSLSSLVCAESCTYSQSSCLCTTGRCKANTEKCVCTKTGCGCAPK